MDEDKNTLHAQIDELEKQLERLRGELVEKDRQCEESLREHVHFSSFAKLKHLTDKKIAVLNTIIHHGVAISNLHSPMDILNTFLDIVVDVLKVEKACIFLPVNEKATTVLKIAAGRGISIETLNKFHLRVGEGLAGWAFKNEHADLVYDAGRDERFLVRKGHKPRRETIMVVPVQGSDRVNGVVCAEKPLGRENIFSRNELDYLIILTNFSAIAIRNARLHLRLQRRLNETFTLMEISEAITSTLNLDHVLNLILKNLSRIIGVQRCSIMLLNPYRTHLSIRATLGFARRDRQGITAMGEGIAGRVAATGESLLIQDIDTHPHFKRKRNDEYISKSLLCVPLRFKAEVIGVLNITNKRGERAFTEVDQKLVSYYADLVSIAIENAHLYTQVERMATTDSLTGLANHRYFQDTLAASFSHARSNDNDLSLIMIDVDNFKRLNDTFGHLAGDAVLRSIGATILEMSPVKDIFPSRYGGEEFAIIMPGWNTEETRQFAERLRHEVMNRSIPLQSTSLSVTMCCGVSSMTTLMNAPQDLIEAADIALYKAKRAGKNQTQVAESPES